jgi:hypothetical protein
LNDSELERVAGSSGRDQLAAEPLSDRVEEVGRGSGAYAGAEHVTCDLAARLLREVRDHSPDAVSLLDHAHVDPGDG